MRPTIAFYFTTDRCARGQTARSWRAKARWLQIGMAPLGLFPVTYLAPSDVGPTSDQEAKRRFQFSIANACDRWKRFARRDDQFAVESSLLHGRSGVRLRAMERQRQRRLLAELRLGPGRQRSLSDHSRRGVRELERKLTENSRLSFFEIGV